MNRRDALKTLLALVPLSCLKLKAAVMEEPQPGMGPLQTELEWHIADVKKAGLKPATFASTRETLDALWEEMGWSPYYYLSRVAPEEFRYGGLRWHEWDHLPYGQFRVGIEPECPRCGGRGKIPVEVHPYPMRIIEEHPCPLCGEVPAGIMSIHEPNGVYGRPFMKDLESFQREKNEAIARKLP